MDIEELARMMNERFDRIDKRVNDVENGLHNLGSAQRRAQLDIEFLKGSYDFHNANRYSHGGLDYVAREAGPSSRSLKEGLDDYDNINPYF
jgi:hypothetical protein